MLSTHKRNRTRNLRLGLMPHILLALLWSRATQAAAPSGRFLDPGATAPIAAPSDADPMFGRWLVGRKKPIVCRFSARPNTPYQVFVGLSEAHWDRSGQRIMDMEVGGRVVATVDSFQKNGEREARQSLPVHVQPSPVRSGESSVGAMRTETMYEEE
jgi:hypothetical protein